MASRYGMPRMMAVNGLKACDSDNDKDDDDDDINSVADSIVVITWLE
jgi:hypothetical protein